MKRLRRIAKEGGLVLVILVAIGALTAAFVFAAHVANPVKEAEQIAFSPAPGDVALSLCKKPETEITKTVVPTGNYYQARYQTSDVRYDLTWQENGDSIAVERSRSRDFDIWAEQMTPEFLSCIGNHPVTVKEGTH